MMSAPTSMTQKRKRILKMFKNLCMNKKQKTDEKLLKIAEEKYLKQKREKNKKRKKKFKEKRKKFKKDGWKNKKKGGDLTPASPSIFNINFNGNIEEMVAIHKK
uniref:Uncharacterized protein n=1 Tax=Strongyloides venezuelensis TaxID=75913 RepID=A0A0K0G3D7_STRVS